MTANIMSSMLPNPNRHGETSVLSAPFPKRGSAKSARAFGIPAKAASVATRILPCDFGARPNFPIRIFALGMPAN